MQHACADVCHCHYEEIREDESERRTDTCIGMPGGGNTVIDSATIAGTALDAASAASSDRLGVDGMTIVKSSTQTATHESPIQL